MSELNGFITKAELLALFRISPDTYKKITKPGNDLYIPDFPKPVEIFTRNKHRFSTIDVENFVESHSHTIASNTNESSAA